MLPAWIKLAAASEEELFSEVLNMITDLGGIDAAQQLLNEDNKKVASKGTAAGLIALLSVLLGMSEAEVLQAYKGNLRKALADVTAPDKRLKNQLVLWINDPQKRMPGSTYEVSSPGSETTITRMDAPENVAEFISSIRAAAEKVDLDGIPVETLLPLFGHETGWGAGNVYQQTANPGSISATDPSHGSVPDSRGQAVRRYPDLSEGIQAAINLLHRPRYTKALAAAKATGTDGSVEARHHFYDELAAAGYGPIGDPADYAERLKNADKYFYKISQ